LNCCNGAEAMKNWKSVLFTQVLRGKKDEDRSESYPILNVPSLK